MDLYLLTIVLHGALVPIGQYPQKTCLDLVKARQVGECHRIVPADFPKAECVHKDAVQFCIEPRG